MILRTNHFTELHSAATVKELMGAGLVMTLAKSVLLMMP